MRDASCVVTRCGECGERQKVSPELIPRSGPQQVVRRPPSEPLQAATQPSGHCRCPTDVDNPATLMDALRLDLRFALRSLRRRPTFTAVAITTIALSIAAATSIYSVVDGVLFR